MSEKSDQAKPAMPVKPMLDALFALQAAVPDMHWNFDVGSPNIIGISCTLTDEQRGFLQRGREMFS